MCQGTRRIVRERCGSFVRVSYGTVKQDSVYQLLGIIWRSLVTEATFPGGSKSRVNRAGESIRQGTATTDDLFVIEDWRAAHRGVLNTFQAILRNRTRGTKVSVAQRHKRKMTIFDKLMRLPGMQLARMDDVAGCRLIFRSIKDLQAFRSKFHKARFNHKLRNDPDKYDYIRKPKRTGYVAFTMFMNITPIPKLERLLQASTSKFSTEPWFNTLGQPLSRLLGSSPKVNRSFNAVTLVTSGQWLWPASCSPVLTSNKQAPSQPHQIKRY